MLNTHNHCSSAIVSCALCHNIFTLCGVACLTLLSCCCCCGVSIVFAAACLAHLRSASLCDPLPSLLCHRFHTATPKSMGVSIWSWIGGYLLAFCGIHHHPISPLSLNFLFLLQYVLSSTLTCPGYSVFANDDTLIIFCNILFLEFKYFIDMNGVYFQVLYFIILPVASSLWVFCCFSGSLTPFQTQPNSFPTELSNKHVWIWKKCSSLPVSCQWSTPHFSALKPRKWALSWKSSPTPKPQEPFGQFSCILMK